MLDSKTKRRIDDARDILVGKIPDPKSQVEQITIALIYKFMDDMDVESEEFGGEAKFFVGEYKKYSWRRVFNKTRGGQEILLDYREALQKLSENPELPSIFHTIFRQAYLPYNDPETLKEFLKIIDKFSYDHSEELGDAFEYLLSVLGSQGDAGQFRTPRHIIDFMVDIVQPKKNETILDPACGTAGFLISAYKYILRSNSSNDNNRGDKLTPDERKALSSNINGYDISPDMVRLSLVNMYLHSITEPKIIEYDTLTTDTKWNEYFDVILANPPFMSPKGGIKPHSRFSVQSKRSEALFVDYIAEHLTTVGRGAVIVPEGVIFKSDSAFTKLRKMLIDDHYLYGVVSLPAGVFNPYSGVKTSILLFDKPLARLTDKILFAKINNEGFDLGAQRRPNDRSELPDFLAEILDFRTKTFRKQEFTPTRCTLVEKKKIAKSGDFNLSGERYEYFEIVKSSYNYIKLGEVLEYEQPTTYIVESVDYDDKYETPVLTAGKSFILGYTNEKTGICNNLPVIIFDDFTTATKYVDFPFKVKSSAMKILRSVPQKADIKYLYYTMQNIKFNSTDHKRYWISEYSKIEIPLPSLDEQKAIVAEVEGYQKIIDAARTIIDTYRPQITIDPAWPMVELGKICEITSSKRIYQDEYVYNGIPFYRTKEIVELSTGKDISLELYISEDKYNKIKDQYDVPMKEDILISAVGTIGTTWIIPDNRKFYFKDGNLIWIKHSEKTFSQFLKIILDYTIASNLNSLTNGAAYHALTIINLKRLQIALPDLVTQEKIVAGIEKEQQAVNSAKQLIEIFEQKISDRIVKVWGE